MSKSIKAIAILGVVAGLGVAALPMSSYAADPSVQLSVAASIADTLAITVTTTNTDTSKIDFGAVTNNADPIDSANTATMNVKSNNKNGYKVTYAATALAGVNSSETIAFGVPTKGSSAWGFKVADAANVVTNAKNYFASLTDDIIISRSDASTDTGDTYSLTFGISAKATQAADTYSGTVTFTAANNA